MASIIYHSNAFDSENIIITLLSFLVVAFCFYIKTLFLLTLNIQKKQKSKTRYLPTLQF
jgi:hypothetical protein